MGQTILGRVGLVTAGTFIPGNLYLKNDIVSSDNAAYIARKDNKDVPLPKQTDETWQLIGKIGQDGKGIIVLSNGNFGNWDENTQSYVDSGISADVTVDVANTQVAFTEASVRSNIDTDEKVSTIFGKIHKWFSDLKALAFKDKVDYTTDIENTPEIPTNTTQLENGANFQTDIQVRNSISEHNASGTAHNDIRSAVNKKVDKDGNKVLSDNNFTDTYKNAVDNNSTQIQALMGAVVYLGNIDKTTIELEVAGGQILLTNRANEIITEQGREVPLRKGDTLVDINNNDWWFNGALWVNIGYTAVSIATEMTLGVVKGSPEIFKISIDANGVMSVNGIQSVDKSATITAANWVQQGDGTYNAIVYDSDILEDSKVSAMPADSDSFDMYVEAIVFGGTSSVGRLLMRSKNTPSGDMDINYTISI